MSQNALIPTLKKALVAEGPLSLELFNFDLKDGLEEFLASKLNSKEDFFFAVTENRGHVAMLLIDENNQLLINEQARAWLKAKWRNGVYERNMRLFIPQMAEDLTAGYIAQMGFTSTPA